MPELLAVSFAFPPLAYPRAGQVARLLRHLQLRSTLVCADERGARQDLTLEPEAESHLHACLRVPFSRRFAERAALRLHLPLRPQVPDEYASWIPSALKTIKDFSRGTDYRPALLATFGHPMSDHLIGLQLKELFQIPWVAHFSDPWIDNPFHLYDARSSKLNLSLERKVVESAERLIFTSEETTDLVMSKYPATWKAKARVLPHCFDPSQYPVGAVHSLNGTLVRHTGEFYGRRTPKPLVKALQAILVSEPQLLSGVSFELIGPINPEAIGESGLEALPEGLVRLKPPVNYQECLELTASADGLLIIDAPAEQSVFLPSKLIDYVGAGRPILGLSPPGTAAKLIRQLGGWVADPSDVEEMRQALREFIFFLAENKPLQRQAWGQPEVRKSFEASVVADLFEGILRELLP